ncbi:HAMP domain-containing histidine kinase [Paenibacillus sp. sptzw28]|uniref:sensor histidine kinase n=1 Tax=Paenibacillus sp. sptzw28 TaxID=715179 RepID=UPI001C6E7AA7|nr:sensor histidine kinase [Paenibacillus sp. sptzw28]QYR20876.1 HAMP domain-containing histidine kinase [Paenibacillus sp. sptzw28]
MKTMPKALVICIILLSLFSFTLAAAHSDPPASAETIIKWEMKWETSGNEKDSPQAVLNEGEWSTVLADKPVTSKSPGVTGAWIKITLPKLPERSGILIERVYGQEIKVFIDDKPIYQSSRPYAYDIYRLLLPLSGSDSDKILLIHTTSSMDMLGLTNGIQIGDYQSISEKYMKADLLDIVLGCAFLFIAVVMLICSAFLSRMQLPGWISLSLIILSVGVLIMMYSPFLYTYYGEYGKVYLHLFDGALVVFLVSLTFFFEKMFEGGYFGIFRKFRKFQIGYSVLCLLGMVLNDISTSRFYGLYHLITVTVLGIIMMVQFALIIGMLITYVCKGNKDAVIITVGFGIFAVFGIGELALYFARDGQYNLYLWKWGIVGFIFSLIILLGKKFAYNHDKIVKYSKELEMYNHQLQRSEKMEVISQLAASVAHEVRNPLQVTRGFLQLLGDSMHGGRERNYLKLAIEELDRAASIITNYLTFAKPQMEQTTILNLAEELSQVEGILVPLANLQGGKIEISIPKDLYIQGNSSKMKQAFINILKNSIEALRGNGRIHLWAYEERGEVFVHVRDNGEGMEENMLKRLGEPYFSNKTKGTGLGLMVTFRIIELMDGKLEFKSERGKGTEAIVRFPAVRN